MIDHKTITKEKLWDIDMDKLKPWLDDENNTYPEGVHPHITAEIVHKSAGIEHYRLLAYVSTQLSPNTPVYDFGSYLGFSALALSYNEKIKVISLDIADYILESIKPKENIEFVIENCIDYIPKLKKDSVIMLDIDPHDGKQEREFYDKLLESGWTGYLLCDDIHLSTQMQEFWDYIQDDKKHDLTMFGHYTGTGLVIL